MSSVSLAPPRPTSTLSPTQTSLPPLASGEFFSLQGRAGSRWPPLLPESARRPDSREVSRLPVPRTLPPALGSSLPIRTPPAPIRGASRGGLPGGWVLQAQRVGVVLAVAAALEGAVWLHQHQAREPVEEISELSR